MIVIATTTGDAVALNLSDEHSREIIELVRWLGHQNDGYKLNMAVEKLRQILRENK